MTHKINPLLSPHYCTGFNFQESYQVLKMRISERYCLLSDRGRREIILFKSFQKFLNNKVTFFNRQDYQSLIPLRKSSPPTIDSFYLPISTKVQKSYPTEERLVKVNPRDIGPTKD